MLKSAGEEMAEKESKRKEIEDKYKQSVEELKINWKILEKLPREMSDKQLLSFREIEEEAAAIKQQMKKIWDTYSCIKGFKASLDEMEAADVKEMISLLKEEEAVKEPAAVKDVADEIWDTYTCIKASLDEMHATIMKENISLLKQQTLHNKRLKEGAAAVKEDVEEAKISLLKEEALNDKKSKSRIIALPDEMEAANVKEKISLLKEETLNNKKLKEEEAVKEAAVKEVLDKIWDSYSCIEASLDEMQATIMKEHVSLLKKQTLNNKRLKEEAAAVKEDVEEV